MTGWQALDLDLLLLVNQRLGFPAMTSVMSVVTEKANWLVPLILVAVWLAWWGSSDNRFLAPILGARRGVNGWPVLLGMVLAVSLADFGSNAIKHAIGRQRPCRDPAVSDLVDCRHHVSGNRSFPSSHAANSAAMATMVIASIGGPAGCVAGGLAFVTGFSRVYLGVHYPSDVLAGWIVGIGHGLLAWAVLRRRLLGPRLSSFTAPLRRGVAHTGRETVGAPWETLPLVTPDGYELEAFLNRASGREIVIVLHGLSSGCMAASPVAASLGARDLSVMMVPLRGHEWHPCPRSTGGIDECFDLIGAIGAAEDAGWKPESIMLYGYSMGACVALRTCGLLPACLLPGGVIADAPFVSFERSARRKLGPLRSRLLMATVPHPVAGALAELDLHLYCSLIDPACRVVFMAGERDSICTIEDVSGLRDVTPGASMIALEGRGHPVWRYGFDTDPQIDAALDWSLERIRAGDGARAALVDESGRLYDDTRSS